MSKLAFLAAIAALVLPAAALADPNCAIQSVVVGSGSQQVSSTYDPFDATDLNDQFRVTLNSDGNNGCLNRNVFLHLEDLTGATGPFLLTGPGGRTLIAEITDDRGRPQHGGSDFFNEKAGENILYLKLAHGQIVPPGVYRDDIVASAWLDNGNNSGADQLKQDFQVVVTVGPVVGLAPVNGLDIDVGEMQAGKSAATPALFDAYANVDYKLRLLSDNGFKMTLNGAPAAVGAAYVPVLDQSQLPASDASALFDLPSNYHERHALNVLISSIAGLAAGNYQDVLTVEITPRY